MEKSANNKAFIVDLGETMVNSSNLDNSNDRQKLYCKCGAEKEYRSKIMRNVVKNYDELIEDSQSIESVKCDSCGIEYNFDNKVCLLSIDKEELFHIKYSFSSEKDKSFLRKTKSFVTYNSKSDKLSFRDVVDVLEVDLKKSLSRINLNPPHDNAESMISTSFSELNIDSNKSYSSVIDLTNISVFEEFFNYIEFINYEGLYDAFKFVQSIDFKIKDLNELKQIPFLGYLYSNHKIESKEKDGKIQYYQEVDSGFGDGSKVQRKLVFGDYLKNLEDVCELLFSIISFPSISTVVMSKGYEFFDKMIHSSSHIMGSEIYELHNATNPNKIIEVSLNYNNQGKRKAKEISENVENDGYLKISSTINQNIHTPTEMDILLDLYSGGFLTKNEIETLFQKYDSSRLYKLFKQLTKTRTGEFNITIKHIEHILKSNIDDGKSDFLNIYTDTMRTIDLLEQKEKMIFKCKDFTSLKEMHDDLSARYGAIKDERKAEIYIKSVEPFKKLNAKIGDVVFNVVEDTQKLNLEGLQMNHCIYTYLNRICDRKYIAINVTHLLSKERATAGFYRDGNSLEFDQLKGFYNSRASSEMIQATKDFCDKHKISFRNNYDLNPDSGRTRLMPGQLNEQELDKLRKKLKKENETKKQEPKEESIEDSLEKANEIIEEKKNKNLIDRLFSR